jgi:very-short-patch-repair endonuclease
VGPLQPHIDAEKVPRDRLIAELALYRVVSCRELEAAGIPRGSIRKRLATGRLYLIHPGVYAVGHPDITLRGLWRAAVLACGPGAVLSHRDAAHLWGIRESHRRPIDVTAPGRSRHVSERITVHRPRALDPRDVTCKDGIPVTIVPRTLLDCAEVLKPRQLRRAWDESQRLDLFDRETIQELMDRSPGRHGLRPLGALMSEYLDAPHTREELEARFADMVRDFDLPRPIYNAALLGYEIDALYEEERIAIELDGFEFHGKSRAQHERDRVKQLDLQLAGYTVVRLTWRMLNDPARAAAQIQNLLSACQVASVAPA